MSAEPAGSLGPAESLEPAGSLESAESLEPTGNLRRLARWCGVHPALALAAVVCIPEVFLLLMGLLCKAVPHLLTASAAFVAGYALLWAAGMAVWIAGLIGRARKGRRPAAAIDAGDGGEADASAAPASAERRRSGLARTAVAGHRVPGRVRATKGRMAHAKVPGMRGCHGASGAQEDGRTFDGKGIDSGGRELSDRL